MVEAGTKGRCLCGAVTFEVATSPKWTALCHCDSCRRAGAAAVVPWMGFAPDQVIWTGERKFYQSSDIAQRGFCPTCGTQMSFESTRWPGEIHLIATTLEQPEDYEPQLHCHTAEHLSWLKIDDGLPRYERSAET